MRIYIMRHGDAIAQAKTDAQRPLSEYGRAQAASMVQYLLPEPPATVLVSPYLRAKQTAQIVIEGLARQGINVQLQTAEYITPNGNAAQVITNLENITCGPVMLISHQPLVSCLISLLTEGHEQGGVPMMTAALASIDCEVIAEGVGVLAEHKTP